MAKVKIQGHASGTGVFTLTSPNSNTDRTITLPDGTGTLAFTTGDDDKLPLSGGAMTGDLTISDSTAPQLRTKTAIGTSAHESGGGFSHVGHATQGSRKAIFWLDADGGDFSGSDYYYIEKTGGGGVQHILQNSADMKFATGGTTRMTISNAGKVGFGTSSPQNKVHIATGDSSNNNFRTGTDTPLIIETAGSAAYIGFVADSGQPMGILMGDTSNSNDTASGGVTYDSNAGGLRLTSGGAHRLYAATNGKIGINGEDSPDAALHIGGSSGWIDIGAGNRAKVGFNSNDMYMGSSASAGNVIFKSGITSNGNPADSGTEIARIQSTGGISFNGDTAAANALDDYEEGTWTPSISTTSGGSNMAYSGNTTGHYRKIGGLVQVFGMMQLTAKNNLQAGSVFVQNFPFTMANIAGEGQGGQITEFGGFSVNFNTPILAFYQSGKMLLRYTPADGSSTYTNVVGGNVGNSSYFRFNATYTT